MIKNSGDAKALADVARELFEEREGLLDIEKHFRE
jgi:hypothetical protein